LLREEKNNSRDDAARLAALATARFAEPHCTKFATEMKADDSQPAPQLFRLDVMPGGMLRLHRLRLS
jgi:hypothetical protein